MPKTQRDIENEMEGKYYQIQAKKGQRVEAAKKQLKYENSPISKFKRSTAYFLPGEMAKNAKKVAKKMLGK